MNQWWGMAQWPLRLDACARACKILEAQERGVKFNLVFWAAFGISTHGKMRGTCASKWSELPLLTFMEHVTIICIYHCIQESQMVFLWVKLLFTNPISLTSADKKRMGTACTECCIIKVEVALVIIRTTVSTWDKNELKQFFFLKIVGFGSPNQEF